MLKLVTRPQQPLALDELVDSETARLIKEPESGAVLDQPAIADLQRRYAELNRDESKYEDDPLVRAENEKERAIIAAELKKAIGPGGRRRKLGRTPADQAWDALTKSLRRLWPRLRNANMPGLAAHLENTIAIDRPHVTYRPPGDTPPWIVEP